MQSLSLNKYRQSLSLDKYSQSLCAENINVFEHNIISVR